MKAIMPMLGQFLRERLIISAFIALMVIIGGTLVWWECWGWYASLAVAPPPPGALVEWDTLIIDTDKAALPSLESPNGLGLYPDIPSDYPLNQN